MINIEYKENLEEQDYIMIDTEFNKYAAKHDITCNYTPFNFLAKDGDKVIGMITGHSYYEEIHIGDLIVLEEYRKQHIGSKLVKQTEDYFKDKGFGNINLTTYGFQALDFYKKCGYEVEYVRENKNNPKLNKYFLVKYL